MYRFKFSSNHISESKKETGEISVENIFNPIHPKIISMPNIKSISETFFHFVKY